MKVGSDMARPSLFTHRKFVRLSRLLGATYKAAGVLETIWYHAYEDGNPKLGNGDDVEFMIGWDGESGGCVNALIESGFLDLDDDGGLTIHDLDDHAPRYVANRAAAEASRKDRKECEQCGTSFKSHHPKARFCSDFCRKKHWEMGNPTDSDDSPTDSDDSGRSKYVPPAPAPAPAHNKKKESPLDSLERKKSKYPEDFEQFWEAYPKKKSKGDALKAWKQMKKDRPPIDDLLSKIDELMSSKDWQKDGGQWIPYPATWIRAGGWDDETKTSTRQGGKYAREETDYDSTLNKRPAGM